MALTPTIIAGNLNFGSVPGMDDYGGAYANALSLNQQNYANILKGYQQLMSGQVRAEGSIQQGYGQLSTDVLNDIANIGASQQQAINDAYAQQMGATQQQLINSGLGNSTVLSSARRGVNLDKAKADIALSNQMAQLRAGYRSNLGMAGLNYANQANMQNTALGAQQLGFMNSVQAPYPNALDYGRLAMMKGALRAGVGPYGFGFGGFGGGGRVSMPAYRAPNFSEPYSAGMSNAVSIPPVNYPSSGGYSPQVDPFASIQETSDQVPNSSPSYPSYAAGSPSNYNPQGIIQQGYNNMGFESNYNNAFGSPNSSFGQNMYVNGPDYSGYSNPALAAIGATANAGAYGIMNSGSAYNTQSPDLFANTVNLTPYGSSSSDLYGGQGGFGTAEDTGAWDYSEGE